MPTIPSPEPRYLLMRREIDGSMRPLQRLGRTLIYCTHHLAAAVARPYGPSVEVIDTHMQEIE